MYLLPSCKFSENTFMMELQLMLPQRRLSAPHSSFQGVKLGSSYSGSK